LIDLDQFLLADFVQNDSQHNRQKSTPKQIVQVDPYRIEGCPKGVFAGKEKLKIIQTGPGAAPYTLLKVVVLEGYDKSRHGQVFKQENEEYSRQGHKVIYAIPVEFGAHPPKRVFLMNVFTHFELPPLFESILSVSVNCQQNFQKFNKNFLKNFKIS
jgi:hypothetical protein